jgi:hypothetical protein
MQTESLLFLAAAAAVITLLIIVGRRVRRPQPARSQSQARPAWASRRPEYLERGQQYCELRADFNYTDEKPATSRVTITYFSLDETRREVLADRMIEGAFNQQRAKLRGQGWQEVYQSADREGQSYYYQRR